MRIAFTSQENLQPLISLLTTSLVANGHEIIQLPVSFEPVGFRKERENLELINEANLDLYLLLGQELPKGIKATATIAAAQTAAKLYGRCILTQLGELGYQDLDLIQSQHYTVLRFPRAALEVNLSLLDYLPLPTLAAAILKGIYTVVYSK